MSGLPHQVQRVMEIMVDAERPVVQWDWNQDVKIHGLYVKVPGLRNHRWTKVKIEDLIKVSARRHQWRMEIRNQIDWLCKGEEDE